MEDSMAMHYLQMIAEDWVHFWNNEECLFILGITKNSY